MSQEKNKVTFGFENVHYAMYKGMVSGAHDWDTPVHIPGAVSFSPAAQGNKNDFHADNKLYFTMTTENGVAGDLEMALFPDEFLVAILGWVLDKNKALVQLSNQVPKPFALLFEVMGNIEPIRVAYLYCTGAAPVDGYTTNAQGISIATKKMALAAIPLTLPNGKATPKTSVKASMSPEVFTSFFKKVYVPVLTDTPAAPGIGEDE